MDYIQPGLPNKPRKKRKPYKWGYNECKKEALKYKTRNDFQKGSRGAYGAALRNGWLDDICTHMEVVGNKEKRLIYVYKFSDHSCYVGLTCNSQRRKNEHLNESIVYKKKQQDPKINYTYRETKYKYREKQSQILEDKVEKLYKRYGWSILNIIKTGGLGGCTLLWDKEACKKEASKYNTRIDFKKGSKGAYGAALRNGWLDEICSHMKILWCKKWNKKATCKKEALKYKRRSDFSKGSPGAYVAARKNGWLDDICKHMEIIVGKWTKDRCKLEALKYKTRSDFNKGSRGAYGAASENGWLDEICAHMEVIRGKWTKKTCKLEALKYKRRIDFAKGSPGAYEAAQRNGWLDEICKHMKEVIKPAGYWTKKACKKEALKYKRRSDFQKGAGSAYVSARKNGWLDDICKHMPRKAKSSKDRPSPR